MLRELSQRSANLVIGFSVMFNPRSAALDREIIDGTGARIKRRNFLHQLSLWYCV
jgi:hypothetical protein